MYRGKKVVYPRVRVKIDGVDDAWVLHRKEGKKFVGLRTGFLGCFEAKRVDM